MLYYSFNIYNMLQVDRNIQFSRLVKTNDRLREFNFRKANGRPETVVNIDVVEERDIRIMFKMQKENDRWRIIPQPMPQWLINVEGKLHELIEEELALVQ